MVPGEYPDGELLCGAVGPGRHVLVGHNDVVIPDESMDRARHLYLWGAGVRRNGPRALQGRQNRRGEFVICENLRIRVGQLGNQTQDLAIRSLQFLVTDMARCWT